MKIWPGRPYPLGASFDGLGVNFSVFSEIAERVELCLFDEDGQERRVDLPEVTSFCWHGYLAGLQPGQRYGFRVHGPWAPERGHRTNPAKLLLDPYAKAVEGQVRWDESVFPYRFGDPESRNDLDSAAAMPKSIVVNPYFDWGNDRPPRIPWHSTIIYEIHVKGFTERHPELPRDIRGTYAALGDPIVVDYLRRLGITAVELMPVHQFVHDAHLVERKLRNYWGYNSIGFLAPHNEYSSSGEIGQQVQEFKQMVRRLHEAEIEVILDVVYNHTAEGNHMGPVLSFKGLDNPSYYRLMADDPRYYMDYTGTGNSLNVRHPHVLQLMMDSLRYWVQEMHVDGFRFDLASSLARGLHEVDRLSAFFDLIQQDPVVSQVKLIAEPWDVGEGGYQVGNFPPQWSEWNGKYRDCVRDYWRGMDQTISEFAYRFCGSSDLYATTGRRPFASVNFVTAHDGFTLRDLVSYNDKHNEANGEENRDGESHNRSWNCGAEGPTDDPEILALRARQQRNFLATLLLSQGVPMILGGDELGRTQGGNNNAYCQDNEISWLDWRNADAALLEFARSVIRLRREHPVFHRRRFFLGQPIHGADVSDICWYRPDGQPMSDEDWNRGFAKSLGVFLNGDALHTLDERGEPIVDESFYLIFNGHYEPLDFVIGHGDGERWAKMLDTGEAPPAVPAEAASDLASSEAERVRHLQSYRLLGGDRETAFDDITRLAAAVCGAPFATLSFVDGHRQWFKSKHGFDFGEAARDVSFAARTIEQGAIFEVEDAAADARFASNPFVASEPHVRAYAGVPLLSPQGAPLGVLAVLDREPRRLSDEQKAALEALARQAMAQLELRRRVEDLVGRLAGSLDVPERRRNGQPREDAPPDAISTGEKLVVAARSVLLFRRVG